MRTVDYIEGLSKENAESIADILIRNKGVFGYIFGSCARNEQHQYSDLDIGVYLGEPLEEISSNLLSIMTEILGLKIELDIDVRILNTGDLEFLFKVITDGVILFSVDEVQRIRFEKRVFFEYLDFKPALDTYYYYMQKHLEETGEI